MTIHTIGRLSKEQNDLHNKGKNIFGCVTKDIKNAKRCKKPNSNQPYKNNKI